MKHSVKDTDDNDNKKIILYQNNIFLTKCHKIHQSKDIYEFGLIIVGRFLKVKEFPIFR